MKKRPWLLIVFVFLALFAAWAFFITIAVKNQPEYIQPELHG